jgi:hypothetical protein
LVDWPAISDLEGADQFPRLPGVSDHKERNRIVDLWKREQARLGRAAEGQSAQRDQRSPWKVIDQD